METGARDKHSNLPPLTWGQQTLVSDRMLNSQKKVLNPSSLALPAQDGEKSQLRVGSQKRTFSYSKARRSWRSEVSQSSLPSHSKS